jgi:hypothetical protein
MSNDVAPGFDRVGEALRRDYDHEVAVAGGHGDGVHAAAADCHGPDHFGWRREWPAEFGLVVADHGGQVPGQGPLGFQRVLCGCELVGKAGDASLFEDGVRRVRRDLVGRDVADVCDLFC